MKRIFLFLPLIIGVITSLVLYSCKKQNENQKSEKLTDKEIIEFLKPMGVAHNKGLDFILEKVKSRSEASKTMRTDLAMVTEAEIKDYSYQYSSDAIPLFDGVDPVYTINSLTSYYQDDLNNNIVKVQEPSLELKNAFAEIDTFFNSISNEDETLILQNLDMIMNNNLERIVDYYERVTLISAITVGKSSVHYWTTNIDEWAALNALPPQISKLTPRGEKIMHAAYEDLVGAGVGAWQARNWAMALGGGGPASLAVVGVVGIYEGLSASAGGYLLEKGWGWVKSWFD